MPRNLTTPGRDSVSVIAAVLEDMQSEPGQAIGWLTRIVEYERGFNIGLLAQLILGGGEGSGR